MILSLVGRGEEHTVYLYSDIHLGFGGMGYGVPAKLDLGALVPVDLASWIFCIYIYISGRTNGAGREGGSPTHFFMMIYLSAFPKV